MKNKIKKRIRQAAKNFMLELLEIVKDLPNVLPQPFETKGQYQRRVWSRMRGYPLKKVQLGLHRAKKQGLLKESRKKYYALKLTIEGKHKVLIKRVFEAKIEARDKLSTIVIFDIPEEKSKHRMFLRRLLLKNGFINLQKSVLIGRFVLPDEFFELLKELKIEQNVAIIKGQVQYR